MVVRSIAAVDTVYSADCTEFCPFEGYEDILVCGTYQVIEPLSEPSEKNDEFDEGNVESSISRQTERTGRLLVYQVGENQASMYVSSGRMVSSLTLRSEGRCRG